MISPDGKYRDVPVDIFFLQSVANPWIKNLADLRKFINFAVRLVPKATRWASQEEGRHNKSEYLRFVLDILESDKFQSNPSGIEYWISARGVIYIIRIS